MALVAAAAALQLLFAPEATAKITIESVALVGLSDTPRLDPDTISFPDKASADKATVLCTANGTVMQSDDGGKTFARCKPAGAAAGGKCFVPMNAIATGPGGSVMRQPAGVGVPAGYTPKEGSAGPLWKGPWKSTAIETVTKGSDGQLTFASDTSAAAQSTWGAPPHNSLILFSLNSGGVTALDDSGKNFLATPWLWYADTPIPHPLQCCNGSVVAYVTSDAGRTWTFRSEIASKKTLAAKFASEEGPNENSVVMLSDKKTIFVVMRKDGGDGVPHHYHVPYVFAKSSDSGKTWSLSSAPAPLLSARPRAVALPSGPILIAGGRPALNLWVNEDGKGTDWTTFDIPTEHNKLMADPALKYCKAFENANMSLGWAASSAYTQTLALSPTVALICYERQGSSSGGYRKKMPQECVTDVGGKPGSAIFCMRVRVE